MKPMKVKDLINYLNTIEDKEQEVRISGLCLNNSYEAFYAVEIKGSSDNTDYPKGVHILGDI